MAETQVPTTNHPQAANLSHTRSQPAKPQPAATPSSRDPSGITTESLLEAFKSDLKIFKSDLETAKTHTETAKAHLKTAKSQLENIKSDLETIKLARGHGVDESVVISPPKEAGSSIARFTSDQVYKKQPKKKKKAIADTASFCATSVADAAGVQTANILGGYHVSASESRPHLSVVMEDGSGSRIYLYCISDGTFWDRPHILDPAPTIPDDYIRITEEEFEKGIPPAGYTLANKKQKKQRR